MLGDKDAGGNGGQRNRSINRSPAAPKDGKGRVHHHWGSNGGSDAALSPGPCFERLLANFFDNAVKALDL
jgi:hypothetical protein